MKYILVVLLLLAACTEPSKHRKEHAYLIAGQSNALKTDWSYFEDETGIKTTNIAVGGTKIDGLIELFDPESLEDYNYQGIFFIHGGGDSFIRTPPDYYVARVEEYRQMMSIAADKDLKLLISSNGYPSEAARRRTDHFAVIRNAVRDEAKINSNWVIVFDDAEHFDVWGMLKDMMHYNRVGQILVMDSFIEYVNK